LIANTTSTREKLRIKLNLAEALGQREWSKEAMNVHLDALYSINALPKRFHLAWALREYVMVRSLLKKYADHEVYALPPMADGNTLSAMEHMSALSNCAFLCGNIVTTFLCILRMILTTFKHGLCAETAQRFVGYGIILSGQAEIEMGRRIAKLSKQILKKVYRTDRVRAKNRESITLAGIANFIDPYCIPIPQVLATLQLAYESGMEAGDLENLRKHYEGTYCLL
jgi:predicted ATPase